MKICNLLITETHGLMMPRHSLIHSVVCLTTGPWPLPKWILQKAQSTLSVSSILSFSLMPSCSLLRLLPRLQLTSILPSVFPPVTCFRRQLLRKMWQIKLAFLLSVVYRKFIASSTVCNSSSFLTWSVQMIFSTLAQHHFSKLSRYFLIYFPKCPSFSQHHKKLHSTYRTLLDSYLNLSPICWWK
jgi:hypothetical protein